MTNAWIQRALTIALMLLAGCIAVWTWQKQPYLLTLSIFLPLSLVGFFELMQFALLRYINRFDPSPKASLAEYGKAYAGELITSIKVFNLWQPFMRHSIPDNLNPDLQQLRGVILVHGFFCNRGLWMPWLRQLQKEGRVFVALDLAPAFGSINNYAPLIEKAVQQVWQATGKAPVLVGHSMGGLAIRAWACRQNSAPPSPESQTRVHRVITLGTPHYGTWLGQFSQTINGQQMRMNSQWLLDLQASEKSCPVPPITCLYSNCDNIVFPVSSAALVGADNRLVRGLGHVQMVMNQGVMQMCWALMK